MFKPALNRVSAAARRLALSSKKFQSTQTSVQVSTPETRITTLPNGFKVASEYSDNPTCTLGVWIHAGSRYETPNTNGAANFMEHMAFKGTTNRSQIALETEVRKMGARLDARATREHTVYSAKTFASDMPKAVEILADVVQNNSLAEEDIEREREVILRGMDEAEQDHQQVIFDYLHATGFQQTALSQSVLGRSENIKTLGRQDLSDYTKWLFQPSRMVLAAAGGVDHDKLVAAAKEFFGSAASSTDYSLLSPCRFTGSEIRHRRDDLPYLHVGIAVEGVGFDHPDAIPLMIGSQVIGSWDHTSTNGTHFPNPLVRFFTNDNIGAGFQAFNTMYSDTGLWGLYFVTDNDNIMNCIVRVQDEIMRACLQLSDFEIQRAKNILLTNIASCLDGTTNIAGDIGHQVLYHGRRIPYHELAQKIQDVNPLFVQEAMQKYVYDQCPAVAAIGPTEALPQYIHIRAKMYKINSGISSYL